jgi:NADH:ubiquinone oxidoreductase subunit 5 (subunit L)/multisubunit Na+/H+ antiporter MnhA subunit
LGVRLQIPLLVIASLSILVGGFQMLQQQSIKRILAFSSVSQMGYALMGLAIGTPLALAATAIHIIHHAMVKSALFMSAGMITWRTDIHNLREAGGLARKFPYTFAIFCLGTLSLSGFPLFSGFISKSMLEEAALHVHLNLIAYIAIFGSVLTFAAMARLIWAVFLAPPHVPDRPNLREAPVLALIPITLMLVGSLGVGLFPQWVADHLAWPAAVSLLGADHYTLSVMNPDALTEASMPEIEREPIPFALDVRLWLAPAIVLIAGGVLAYIAVKRHTLAEKRWVIPLDEISRLLRGWHSGIVNDYAFWIAFSTMLLLLAFVVSIRVF